MKKILFMLSSMNIGGVEKSLLSLLSVLPKEKYDITLLLLEKKGGFLKEVPNWVRIEEAIWFKEIKPIIMQSPYVTINNYYNTCCYKQMISFFCTYFIDKQTNNRYLYYKQIFKKVPKDHNRYDLAISYQGPTDIIDYYIAHKVNARKKITWVHFDVTKHSVNQKLYRKLFKYYDKVFIVSNEAKTQLISIFPEIKNKTEVFHNIITPVVIQELSRDVTEFDTKYTGIKIVTVGRLSLEKGQDLAINVLKLLKENGYNVRWYCIGEGIAKGEYERIIEEFNLQDDFILLGAKSNPYPYVAQADIYVQTSRHEGYCLTLAEARCLNKPIITTNFTGATEQIKNGYNGYIVNFNEEELYFKIKHLVDNPNEQKRLESNLLRADLTIEEDVNKLLNYIDGEVVSV